MNENLKKKTTTNDHSSDKETDMTQDNNTEYKS